MLIDFWLSLPPWKLTLALTVFYAATAALLYWLSFGARTQSLLQHYSDVVPAFSGTTVTLFALFLGFFANDVWARNRLAAEAVFAEREALMTSHDVCAVAGRSCADLDNAVRAATNR